MAAARREAPGTEALGAVARAYTDFADANPAVYDAMLTRSTPLHFGLDSVAPLRDAYVELREAVVVSAGTRDVDTLAEVVWAALHGLIALTRSHRLRPDHVTERLYLVVESFGPSGAHAGRPPRARATPRSTRAPRHEGAR